MYSFCVSFVLRTYWDTAALPGGIDMINSWYRLVITAANPAADSADLCQSVSGPALRLSPSNMPTWTDKGTGHIWSPHIYSKWQHDQTGLQQILKNHGQRMPNLSTFWPALSPSSQSKPAESTAAPSLQPQPRYSLLSQDCGLFSAASPRPAANSQVHTEPSGQALERRIGWILADNSQFTFQFCFTVFQHLSILWYSIIYY